MCDNLRRSPHRRRMAMSNSATRQQDLKSLIDSAGFEVIGQRIRRIRTRSNLTIRELAAKAQVSKNTLLSLEQGNPTHISTIKVICRALKLRPEELAGQDFLQPSVAATHLSADSVWYDMNTYLIGEPNDPLDDKDHNNPSVTPFCHLKSRFPDGKFNPNVITLNKSTPSRSHRGEEFVYVLSGKVCIHVGSKAYELSQGESICFWAAEVHSYEPMGKAGEVTLLSIVLDPFPKLTK